MCTTIAKINSQLLCLLLHCWIIFHILKHLYKHCIQGGICLPFVALIKCLKHLKYCFQLQSLQTAGRVWIHSMYISLLPAPSQAMSPLAAVASSIMGPSIDLDKVKMMMDGSEMAAGAQQLLAAMETHNKVSYPTLISFINYSKLFNLISHEYCFQIKDWCR